MKIYGTLILATLYLSQSTAFVVPQTSKNVLVSPQLSYLESLGEGGASEVPSPEAEVPGSDEEGSRTESLEARLATVSEASTPAPYSNPSKGIFSKSTPTLIQGGNTLKTWSFPDPAIEKVHVSLKSNGRPMHSAIDLWHGPDYVATKTKIYVENGLKRPFNGIFATPKGMNTIAVYNQGAYDFPFTAAVEADSISADNSLAADNQRLLETGKGQLVQGNSITSFKFEPHVKSVQVLLKADARNIKAKIEMLQGPNNYKTVIDYYASDGYKRPFYAVIECPGQGNMVRLLNQNSVEFPFTAYVEPYEIES